MDLSLKIILSTLTISLPLFISFLLLIRIDYNDCLYFKDQQKYVKIFIILSIIFGLILVLSIFAIPFYYIWR